MHYSLRSKKTICSVFVLSLMAFPAIAQQKGALVDRIVATVKGDPILASEVEEAQGLLTAELKKMNRDTDLGSPKETQKKVLDQLINDRLVAQEIKRLGMTADDAAIDGAIQSVMRENRMTKIEELQQAIKNEGMTMSELREGYRKQIEQSNFMNRFVRPKVRVEPEDVERVYRQKNSEASKVEKMRVFMIFKSKPKTNRAAMEKLVAQISASKSFEAVAKKETEGPGKEDGGDIGYVAATDIQPELAEALKSLKANERSKVVETNQGFYVLKFTDKKTEEPTGDLAKKNEIKEQLFREEMNRVFEATIHSLREKSNIQIFL